MPSVIFVVGARPNFMKVAPILRAANGAPFSCVLVHTGQHYDHAMSGVFFEQLRIPAPTIHLDVGSGSHGVQTGRIMSAFETFVLDLAERPRGIVVVGDVNSTMAGALVGAKLGVPVAHVEAGLRSFDRTMPEEINRIVTDAVSDLLLVSEPAGAENLQREGIDSERIRYVGNVMIDSLVEQLPAARELQLPDRLGLSSRSYVVVTLHRPSNVDEPARLRELVRFVRTIGTQIPVVFPVHPRTDLKLREAGLRDLLSASPGVRLIDALGYREFIGLMAESSAVITDSGGVQEETTYLGIPCITLRSSTERPITVSAGTNTLVGDDLQLAASVFDNALNVAPARHQAIPGWDGSAASRVVEAISQLVA